jgi:hypothetical protein
MHGTAAKVFHLRDKIDTAESEETCGRTLAGSVGRSASTLWWDRAFHSSLNLIKAQFSTYTRACSPPKRKTIN